MDYMFVTFRFERIPQLDDGKKGKRLCATARESTRARFTTSPLSAAA
jgi:hypothetical protein